MKKRIIILGSVVLAIVIAWSVAWVVLTGIIREQILALDQGDGSTAPRLSCERLDIGGFPFRFDADCTNATLLSGDTRLQWPGLRASIFVYAPTHLIASALGPMQIQDSFTGTKNAVDWATLEASLRLDNWRIARGSVSASDVVWSDTLFDQSQIAQSDLVELHLFDMPDRHDPEQQTAALAGYVVVRDLSYPAMTLSDASAELQLELSGLPDDVRAWGAPDMLATLRANEGLLDVVALRGTDANSTLDASGTLRLDAQGYVDGQLSITSTGVAERISPLLEEPWRTLVLGAPRADGSYANELNFGGGEIFSGLVPIATLPPLL